MGLELAASAVFWSLACYVLGRVHGREQARRQHEALLHAHRAASVEGAARLEASQKRLIAAAASVPTPPPYG